MLNRLCARTTFMRKVAKNDFNLLAQKMVAFIRDGRFFGRLFNFEFFIGVYLRGASDKWQTKS